MVFSSLTFLLLFLPLTLALYFVRRGMRWRNAVLLICSLVFYAWGEPVFVLAMLFVVLVVYAGALLYSRMEKPVPKKLMLFLTLLLALSGLLYFKYGAFFLNTVLPLFGSTSVASQARLPLGISFFTFQAITYAVDVYRGNAAAQKNPALLLLYISCFPQLIAGPIVQYSDIACELTERVTTLDDFSSGMRRFAVGLGKKVLLANVLGEMLSEMPSADASAAAAWMIAGLFALQIYFDFSAYSDMAIGLGRVLGFHYQENFRYPYLADSVSDFWRRWHISLGSFFREYVYIPLGGNRHGAARTVLNLLIVWFLTGLWHGASWNFVLWGLYYGCFIILERFAFQRSLRRVPRALRIAGTLIVVLFGWALFYQTDLSLCGRQMLAMLGLVQTGGALRFISALDTATVQVLRTYTGFPLIACALSLPILPRIKAALASNTRAWRTGQLFETLLLTAVIVLCVMNLVSDSYNPFLYFRF